MGKALAFTMGLLKSLLVILPVEFGAALYQASNMGVQDAGELPPFPPTLLMAVSLLSHPVPPLLHVPHTLLQSHSTNLQSHCSQWNGGCSSALRLCAAMQAQHQHWGIQCCYEHAL